MPPRRLRYQTILGMTTRRARSEAIHWTKKREPNVSCPRKPIAYHAATDEKRLFIGHPPNLVTQHPRLEPADSEEIANPSEEAVPHAIFRNTLLPRTVPPPHLHHPRAPKLAKSPKESVRAHEKPEYLQG